MRGSTLLALSCVLASIAYAIWQETPRGQLQGQVLRASDGKPLAAAQVIFSGGQERWFQTTTDQNGHFTLARVPSGQYSIVARAPRYAADETILVTEGENRLKLETQRVYPKIPPPQAAPNPEAVRIRTLDIVRARYNLSPELYGIIRDNNKSGLPLSLVLAQAGAESSFRPDLIGAAGEIGLFQIQVTTANDVAKRPLTAQQLLEPALNTRLATTYLRHMYNEFGNVRTALAAYNQGPGNTVRRGLFLDAQIYAEAIQRAAWHDLFQERLHAIAPGHQP